jgi:hypothetical protein
MDEVSGDGWHARRPDSLQGGDEPDLIAKPWHTYSTQRRFSRKANDAFLSRSIAAWCFYRLFEYELPIFIACRAFRKGRKMAGTQRCNEAVTTEKYGAFPIESGSVK